MKTNVRKEDLFRIAVAMSVALLCLSCATPQPSTRATISLDEEPVGGGVGSSDIRTMAKNMTPEILALPEIRNKPDPTRIAISPMKNSSRFVIDMNIFMKRLRLELNKYSNDRLRFYSQNNANVVRKTVLDERNEDRLDPALNRLASDLLKSGIVLNAEKPPKIAVIPVLNSNLVNMNADSLTAMLRSRIASISNGKVRFLMPGHAEGADYYLTGQFLAKGIVNEGMVNLADYIEIVEDRLREGKGLNVYDDINAKPLNATSGGDQVVVNTSGQNSSVLEQIIKNSRLQVKPNVTKRLNVMLIDPESKACLFEKMMDVEKKFTQGFSSADYVLSGEITSLSKRIRGRQTDYMLITFQLVEPDTNELLWENGEEIKKQSEAGIVYQ